MGKLVLVLLVALAGCSTQTSTSSGPGISPISGAETVTVVLSSFSFDPDHIRLRAGKSVRLKLVNESDGGHDFSAPAFFAASSFPPGSSAPVDGTMEVGSRQTVEVALVPREPGTYPLRCTHPLHALFGMTGAIEVTP